MNKLFLFVTILITSFCSAQTVPIPSIPFPVRQNIGAPKVLSNTMGATQSTVGIILGNYTDTTEANTNPYIKHYAGAMIRTEGDILWERDKDAKKWLRDLGSPNSTTSVTNMSVLNDSTILVCTGTNVCDTLHINNLTITNVSPNTSYISSDTSIVLCDTLGHCDTFNIPKQQLYIFQNALTSPSRGVIEFGGNLLHNTNVHTWGYHLSLTGYTVYDYPLQVERNTDWQSGSGAASFKLGGSTPALSNTYTPNLVRLGIDFVTDNYQNSPLIPNYFNGASGYFIGVNGTGNGSYGLRVDDITSKVGGIFFHTNDTTTKDAITIYGMPRPNRTYVGGTSGADATLAGKRIATFKNDKQVKFFGYASSGFQVNDTTSYKPVTVDVNGDLWQSNWPVGGINNTNIGDGYRILKPVTQELKTLFAGTNVTIDSTTNANGLTINASGGTTYIDAGMNVSITGTGISSDHYVVNATGISGITADNGLTANISTNTQLGGTLIQPTMIDNNNNTFEVRGTASNTFTTIDYSGIPHLSSVYTDNVGAQFLSWDTDNSQSAVLTAHNGTDITTESNVLGIDNVSSFGSKAEYAIMLSRYSPDNGATHIGHEIIVRKDSIELRPLFTTQPLGLYFSNLPLDSTGYLLNYNPSTGKISYSSGGGTTIGRDSLFGVLDNAATANRTFNSSTYSFTYNTTYAGGGQAFLLSSSGIGSVLGVTNNNGSFTTSFSNSGIGDVSLFTASGGTPITTSTTGANSALLKVNPSSTNVITNTLELRRTSSGTPADGIGEKITYVLGTSTSTGISNELISEWTTAADASRTSRFRVTGVSSTTLQDVFYHYGNGDAETPVAGSGFILKSPDGTKRARISINNSGVLTTTAL